MSISRVRAFSVSAALLLTAAGYARAQSLPVQARPEAATPQLTPFERNLFLFSSPQEAIRALDSPDILMRRSGVEWLGRWTCTYTTYGIAPDKAACAQLQSDVGLVPRLTRAVREMPKEDSQQAVRLLMLLGPSAKPAIPAICAALSSPEYGNNTLQYGLDFDAHADLLNSLTQLCGGPDALISTLATLMQDREPEIRRAAAAAVRFCADPTYRRFSLPVQGTYPYVPPEQSKQQNLRFQKKVFPALTACVDDRVTAVRLDALVSLEWLTYDSAVAPWQATEPALARAAASADPAVRLAALRVLAYMPADISTTAASLRSGLHESQEERNYALAALCHAAQTDRTSTINAFLPDLTSSDVLKRRQAAYDIQLAATPLFAGSFWPGPYPQENWWDDSRLFMVADPPGLTPAQKDAEAKQRQAMAEAAQPILLAALTKSASDPDHAVRTSAASSLEQIGKWTDSGLGGGYWPNPAVEARPWVEQALAKAAALLQATEPDLAKQLMDLRTRILTPHDTA